jgi:hypothetical protein
MTPDGTRAAECASVLPETCTLDRFGGVRIAIHQVEYSNTPDGPIIHIFGRDVHGTAVRMEVTGFRPYFYAPATPMSGRCATGSSTPRLTSRSPHGS